MKDDNCNGLMTVNEAADYLKLKRSAIYQMTMRRSVPFIKIGARVRFRQRDLDKFIEKNEVEVGKF